MPEPITKISMRMNFVAVTNLIRAGIALAALIFSGAVSRAIAGEPGAAVMFASFSCMNASKGGDAKLGQEVVEVSDLFVRYGYDLGSKDGPLAKWLTAVGNEDIQCSPEKARTAIMQDIGRGMVFALVQLRSDLAPEAAKEIRIVAEQLFAENGVLHVFYDANDQQQIEKSARVSLDAWAAVASDTSTANWQDIQRHLNTKFDELMTQ